MNEKAEAKVLTTVAPSQTPIINMGNLDVNSFLQNWRKDKQKAQLERIKNRAALDKFKQEQQTMFFAFRKKVDPESVAELDKIWGGYFSDLCWQDQESATTPAPFSFSALPLQRET